MNSVSDNCFSFEIMIGVWVGYMVKLRLGRTAFPQKFCLLFAFFPFYLGMTLLPKVSPAIDTFLDLWLIAGFFVLLVNCLASGILITKYIKLCFVYFLLIAVSTIVNGADIVRTFNVILNMAMIVLLTDYGIKKDYVFYFSFVSKLTILATVLNICSMFLFPNGTRGVSTLFLLGSDNRFNCTLFPGFCCVMINDILRHRKIGKQSWIEYFLLLFTFVYRQAIGSMLAIAVILPILLIVDTRFARKYIHGLSCFIVQTVAAWLITVVRIFEKFDALLQMLGKDATLTSRTYLWNTANMQLEGNWLLGLGIQSNETLKARIGFSHLHNHFLNVVYQTGWLGLLSFLAIVYHVYMKLYKHRRSLIAQATTLVLFMVFVQLLADSVDNVRNHLFWIMTIAVNVDYICKYGNSAE